MTTVVDIQRRPTAAELCRLSTAERDAILKAAAALAVDEYRKDAALTAFEAFGEDDLHVSSSNAQTR